MQKAYLVSYDKGNIVTADRVEIPDDYDGNQYSSDIGFAVGSNQSIVTTDDDRWFRCVKLAQEQEVYRPLNAKSVFEVPKDFLVDVDSLLTTLLYRHRSFLESNGEFEEVRRLAKEVRELY